MAVNKVIYGGNTLVDLTGDTVTAADLADGVKATGADGKPIVGLMKKVNIDSSLSDTSTNPVQNYVLNRKFNTILLANGQLSKPSSNDAYLCKLAADALSSINNITQMTIEQSADGKTWEMLFDSDTASDEVKLAYLYGLEWPTTIYITKGYMARVTFATHTTTYFANISMYLKAICDSGNQTSYKCYIGFNTLRDNALFQDTIYTWGSWPSSVFTSVGYNIVRYVFNEDKQADLNLWFDGAQCKGTVSTRNVLRFDQSKQITTTPFGIQAPTFNGYTISASVPANAKFTDTVYTHPATHPASMITGLSTVATSGSYNDLKDKPDIVKTVNNVAPDSDGNINITVSGGVSTDTANTWTAAQKFVSTKHNIELQISATITPTTSTITTFVDSDITLDLNNICGQVAEGELMIFRAYMLCSNDAQHTLTIKSPAISLFYVGEPNYYAISKWGVVLTAYIFKASGSSSPFIILNASKINI